MNTRLAFENELKTILKIISDYEYFDITIFAAMRRYKIALYL